MIAKLNQRIDVATSHAGRNFQAQCPDALLGTLVERVCRFLERYPLSPTAGEDVAPPRLSGRSLSGDRDVLAAKQRHAGDS